MAAGGCGRPTAPGPHTRSTSENGEDKAMTHSGSRRGAANLAPVLMIISFLAMAGLLVWLGKNAEGTQPVAMEEDESMDSVEAGAMLVTAAQLQASAANYVGMAIRLEDVPVASRVGVGVFLIELGTPSASSPFLVVLDSALVAAGREAPRSGTVTVSGTVRERTDSAVDHWIETGLVPESERIIVEFSSHWIDASRLREPAAGMQGGAGAAGGGASDGGLP